MHIFWIFEPSSFWSTIEKFHFWNKKMRKLKVSIASFWPLLLLFTFWRKSGSFTYLRNQNKNNSHFFKMDKKSHFGWSKNKMDLVLAANVTIEQFDVEKVAKDYENHYRSAIRASSAAKDEEQKKVIFKNYYCKIIFLTTKLPPKISLTILMQIFVSHWVRAMEFTVVWSVTWFLGRLHFVNVNGKQKLMVQFLSINY